MAIETVPAADPSTLREALKEADMHCQEAQEEIEALCIAAGDRIEKGDATIAKRLLQMIRDRALVAMDSINSRAEQLGATSGIPAMRSDDQYIPRIAASLDEIANEAHAEDRRCYFFDDSDVDEQARLELSRLRSVVLRPGRMADQAGALLGNVPVRDGQAERWLFAPINAQRFVDRAQNL